MASRGRLKEFGEYRKRMNERILGAGHLGINRFFNLDTAAYNDGALSAPVSRPRVRLNFADNLKRLL